MNHCYCINDKFDKLTFNVYVIVVAGSYSFDAARFKQYEKLIQRFVDNKEDRELAALNSVHNLVSKLEHPQGINKHLHLTLVSCTTP